MHRRNIITAVLAGIGGLGFLEGSEGGVVKLAELQAQGYVYLRP